MSKILIIEDEVKLRNELKSFLENNGYEILLITDFSNTLNHMLEINTDLILLDINLSGVNGEILCREYRKEKSVPIIMITSKNTDLDEIISINFGADDFLTKPFNTRVLLARIERLLKRISSFSNIIKYNNLTVDFTKSIISNLNNSLDLSRNENRILSYLLKNMGKIISRDELMDYLWDNNEFMDDNTLTVNINRLRNKLDYLGFQNMIVTKRGQGYIIYENK